MIINTIKYYLEIRNRFILILLTWFFSMFVSYFYKETLLFLFIKPIFLILTPFPFYFFYTNITEIFTTYFKLITFVGNQICFIYLLYHILFFLSPGLYCAEFFYLKLLLIIGIMFWVVSIVILNKFLLPLTLQFFLSFQFALTNKVIDFYFEAKIIEYYQFYITLYYICNFNAQFFTILTVFLNYINGNLIIIKRFRKFLYTIFVVFSTCVVPPDVISQIILSLIIVFFYETLVFSIVLKEKIITH